MALLTRYKTPSAPAQVLAEGHDLSPEGLFISSERPEPLGTLLEVEWEARGSGRTLRALGRVAWVRPEAHGGKPAGMGVEFVKTGPDGRRAISSVPPPAPEDGASNSMPEADPGRSQPPATAAPEGGEQPSSISSTLEERRAKLAALRDRVNRRRVDRDAEAASAAASAPEPAPVEPEAAPVEKVSESDAETVTDSELETISDVRSEAVAAASTSEDDEGADWDSAPTTLMTAGSLLASVVAADPEPAPTSASAQDKGSNGIGDAHVGEEMLSATDAPADADAVTATDVGAPTTEAKATGIDWDAATETDVGAAATPEPTGEAANERVVVLEEEEEDEEHTAKPPEDDVGREATPRAPPGAPTHPDSARPFLLKGDVPKAQFRAKPWIVGAAYVATLSLVVWAIWIRLPWQFLEWLETPARPASVASSAEAPAAPATAPVPATAPAPPIVPEPSAEPAAPAPVEAVVQEYELRVTTVPPRAQATVGDGTILTPGTLSLGALAQPVTLSIRLRAYEPEDITIDREGFVAADGIMKRTLAIDLLPLGTVRTPTAAPEPTATTAAAPATPQAPEEPAAPAPASAPEAPKAPTSEATPKPARPKAAAPKPAAVAEPAPAPAPEEPKVAPLKAAQECLMKGDNACAIQALEGKARTPREMELLIETYRATGNPSKQWATMKTYVERFPDEKKAASYRQTLGE